MVGDNPWFYTLFYFFLIKQKLGKVIQVKISNKTLNIGTGFTNSGVVIGNKFALTTGFLSNDKKMLDLVLDKECNYIL